MANRTFFVVGVDREVSHVFLSFGLKEEFQIDKADIVVFTGGADIDPERYGEKRINGTYCNIKRDDIEFDLYWESIIRDQTVVGICRGGQLIHVANGGSMWQDVNNHAGKPHYTLDLATGEYHLTTSCHHQMMRVDNIHDSQSPFEIVAIASESTYRSCEKGTNRLFKQNRAYSNDIEVLWYPKTKSLCYQPHPEYRLRTCTNYFQKLLIRYEIIEDMEQLDLKDDKTEVVEWTKNLIYGD